MTGQRRRKARPQELGSIAFGFRTLSSPVAQGIPIPLDPGRVEPGFQLLGIVDEVISEDFFPLRPVGVELLSELWVRDLKLTKSLPLFGPFLLSVERVGPLRCPEAAASSASASRISRLSRVSGINVIKRGSLQESIPNSEPQFAFGSQKRPGKSDVNDRYKNLRPEIGSHGGAEFSGQTE